MMVPARAFMVTAVLALVLQTANPPGFIMWTQAQLLQRDAALSANVGSDGSSRETLADYSNPTGAHRFRLIRRESTGFPETHENIVDVVFMESGQGEVLVGGQQVSTPGGNVGGTRYSIGPGDILHIPAHTPHSYIVPEGGHVTYVLVRVPVFKGEPVEAADAPEPDLSPPGFAMWSASELARRDAALSPNVGQDPTSVLYGSSRETLADFGNPSGAHRFRLIRREADGIPETHADIVDLVYIQSGDGTLQVGGEQVSHPGGNTGGVGYSVAAGDIIHIPATYPHAYLVPPGGNLTYVLVRVPAFFPEGQ